MLISPTHFFNNLEGKSKEEILLIIRRLKRSITKLKKAIENPDLDVFFSPSNELTLKYTREYLKLAKIALSLAGGEYKPTKAEERAEKFDENISKISKIEFMMGSFFTGHETRIYTICEDKVCLKIENLRSGILQDVEIDKKLFFEGLSELYIGEWKSRYVSKKGKMVMDGIEEWHLHFYYEGGLKPFKIYGHNDFPYNYFGEFMEWLGIKQECEDEE